MERFDASLGFLTRHLNPYFPELALWSRRDNASLSRPPSMTDRLSEIRNELGDSLYRRLVDANEADLDLWTRAGHIFDAKLHSGAMTSAR